jgi:hypothetical protein
MTSAFDPVDSWFEDGFRIRRSKGASAERQTQRDKRRADAGGAPAPRGAVRMDNSAKTKNIKAVIRKAPEVMVKITGSSDGLAAVKRHLEYISRNGRVELLDEAGRTLERKKAVEDYRRQLKAAQIPEMSGKREFLHIAFSMPAGTPAQALKDAVAQFCQEEYSNRRWVMGVHEDTKHTHVHVCVGTRDIDRADEPRLSPRKADLFRWRQGFAEKLRELGVDSAASYRQHRFKHQKAENGVIRQIRAGHPELAGYNAERASARSRAAVVKALAEPETAFVGPFRPPRAPKVLQQLAEGVAAAIAEGRRPTNPASEQMSASRRDAIRRWTEVQRRLEAQGSRELEDQIAALLADGKSEPKSLAQTLFDEAEAINRKAEQQFDIDTGLE